MNGAKNGAVWGTSGNFLEPQRFPKIRFRNLIIEPRYNLSHTPIIVAAVLSLCRLDGIFAVGDSVYQDTGGLSILV